MPKELPNHSNFINSDFVLAAQHEAAKPWNTCLMLDENADLSSNIENKILDGGIAIAYTDHHLVHNESFSGLDVGNIEDVKRAFNMLSSSHDFNTIIYSTHDIELAVELADSIYVIGYPTIDGKQ